MNTSVSRRYGNTGNKKQATCFATLLQNELKSDVVRFTTHFQICQQPDLVQDRFDEGGKTQSRFATRFAAVLKTSCPFFAARFSVPLVPVSFSD